MLAGRYNCSIVGMDHERVGRNVQESAKALLARPQRASARRRPALNSPRSRHSAMKMKKPSA